MTAVMDLDLNCLPPSPEHTAQEDLRRSMLRQEHAFRDQVKDLHRLYWAQKNLTDVPPFWKQSDDVLYAHHPHHRSHMVDLDDTGNPGVFSHFYGQGEQGCGRDDDEVARENFDVKGSIRRKPDPPSVQGRSRCRFVIDLEKPATLDDDVEIVSSPGFVNYATCSGVSSCHSQRVPLESSPVMRDLCRDHNTPYVSSGSTGSSDTPDNHSPAKAKTTVSGRMFIDLNVAQEDDFSIRSDPSEVLCSLLASSTKEQSGDFCNISSKTFHKGSESSIGSLKGSSITVVTTISAPDSAREGVAAGLFCDFQSHQPYRVEDKIFGSDSQGCMEIRWNLSSVNSNGGNNSSSGLSKLGDTQTANLIGQPVLAVHREPQEETIAVISDDEVEGIDLNVAVESIDLPSNVASNSREELVNNDGSEENSCNNCFTQNEGRQNVPSVECPAIRNNHMAESQGGEDVQSPCSGIAMNRSVFILENPQGHDYACPSLRSSSNGVSIPLDSVSIRQAEMGEDEKSTTTAAETLLSIFATNSAWMTDSHGNNSQTDAQVGNHKPTLPLDSFEESVLSLEEMKDDGESIPVRPPDKDGPSCGIKLKRGRGLRDFQREILPGLVSLARHEICDDLHTIGYEIRKNRSRRTSGDQCTPTRTRLPRRCSTAWNL
ncbi:uncharacterized protein LOC133917146 isoform X2 [Phragmites australis]|uniref:uncharacterized protein LOC133917146 isoform X2 n=1 Tax=Phragmites australis TaxID=29695 RepID=UPI002D764E68|nr:uncharacterized protein LOC133917146 isoform X2 [Phragmites australis]XP_062217132.1 uncharacterized protein LOC133917146 isoform X2 [Phragmites australis]